MAEHPRIMLNHVIGNRINGNTDAGSNFYMGYVPENKARPYIVVIPVTNLERHFHTRVQDPDIVLLLKAVSTNEKQALVIAQQVKELLDDQGEQDKAGLVGGDDWHILRCRADEGMSQSYKVGSSRVFEECINVRITLQEK